MTVPTTSAVLMSDTQLLRIAVERRERLFPYLNRTSVFAPLILACCILPALQLLTNPTLDDEASMWGLRALAASHAPSPLEAFAPGSNESGQPLQFQPPLAPWLNAITVRMFGSTHLLACTLVPLMATAIAIWVLAQFARKIGGANAALTCAILACSLPQTLKMAISPSSDSIGLMLMAATVFSFQRHQEGSNSPISLNLILSSVTWGLSILALGPIAFFIPLMFVVHASDQRLAVDAPPLMQDRWKQGWPVLRSTLILFGIGIAIGGWWQIVMLREHGLPFWMSWINSLPEEYLSISAADWQREPLTAAMPNWVDWVNQHALLIGWMVFGVKRAWGEARRAASEMSRRRFQLLLLWWAIALVGRLLIPYTRYSFVVNTAIWNLALLGPTLLMASLGVSALVERTTSQRSELLLIALLLSMTVYRLSLSWWLAGLAALVVVIAYLIVPRMKPEFTGPGGAWAEQDWRQILQTTVYVSILTCVAFGIGSESLLYRDEDHLAELREKLLEIPEVGRISLISTRDPIPLSLRYLLRCRWPDVSFVTSDGWDTGLTRSVNEESPRPASRYLILEWTRRNVHLSVDTFHGWQMKSIGDPMRFHGRRLSLILIEAQPQ